MTEPICVCEKCGYDLTAEYIRHRMLVAPYLGPERIEEVIGILREGGIEENKLDGVRLFLQTRPNEVT